MSGRSHFSMNAITLNLFCKVNEDFVFAGERNDFVQCPTLFHIISEEFCVSEPLV